MQQMKNKERGKLNLFLLCEKWHIDFLLVIAHAYEYTMDPLTHAVTWLCTNLNFWNSYIFKENQQMLQELYLRAYTSYMQGVIGKLYFILVILRMRVVCF